MLIVDDSATVRGILQRQLNAVAGIEVVGVAPDPYVARDKVVQLQPDVLTLDVEMPRMDGITFLKLLMRHRPTPTIVVSSLTPRGSRSAVAALEAGAVDVVCKPDGAISVGDLVDDLVGKIRAAARARLRRPITTPTAAPASIGRPLPTQAMVETTDKVLAIGASTGGVQALTAVLPQLPADAPGCVVVQHMPAAFTGSFARRLDEACRGRVTEASDGESVLPGHILIAPGGRHMRLTRSGSRYLVRLTDGPPVHHQKPAVDILFESVATAAGANATGVILTGMGADGAAGLLAMRRAGARTIGQDEATCVVYGMPAEAVRVGAVEEQVPLERVAEIAMSRVRRAKAA